MFTSISVLLFGGLPGFFPLLLVIWGCILIILLYLYKYSDVINKKWLRGFIAFTALLFLVSMLLLWMKNPPPEDKPRVAILPFVNSTLYPGKEWQAWALSEAVGQYLRSHTQDEVIIYPVEWTFPVIISDSLKSPQYVSEFPKRICADFFIYGQVLTDKQTFTINYQFRTTHFDTILSADTLSSKDDDIFSVAEAIGKKLMSYLPGTNSPGSVEQKVFLPAFKNYLFGKQYFLEKNYPRARSLFEKAITLDSTFVPLLASTAKCYLQMGLLQKSKGESPTEYYEQARKYLQKAARLDTANSHVHCLLGQYYISTERWSLAERELKTALRLNSYNSEVYFYLTQLHPFRYQNLGFYDEEELLKRALFINPCFTDAYIKLADLYYFENKRPQAIQTLEELLHIYPHSIDGLMALGKIYIVRNEILKIIEVFNKVIELDPTNSDAYYNLGILYYNSQDYENATRLFQRAIEIDNHLNSYLYLAYIYESEEKFDKAIEYLRKRIRYRKGLDDPFAEEARKHLFQLMNQQPK